MSLFKKNKPHFIQFPKKKKPRQRLHTQHFFEKKKLKQLFFLFFLHILLWLQTKEISALETKIFNNPVIELPFQLHYLTQLHSERPKMHACNFGLSECNRVKVYGYNSMIVLPFSKRGTTSKTSCRFSWMTQPFQDGVCF